MLRLDFCLTHQHDPWMLALAALICASGCYATFATGVHAVTARDLRARLRWGAVCLAVITCTVWATHFIAMIAVVVPFPSGFEAGLTILSFGVALVLFGISVAIAVLGRSVRASTVAGAVTGIAISAMHFTGMAAFRTTGAITWDWFGVASAIVVGVGFGALAGYASWDRRPGRVWVPALMLTLAVCGDHFVAMSAATVTYDPSIALPVGLVAGRQLSTVVVAVAVFITGLILLAHGLHRNATRRLSAERERFQEFADFSIEGLLICDGDRIVWANRSIEAMTGEAQRHYIGRSLDVLFEPSVVAHFSADREIDTVIGSCERSTPVRVITKQVALADRPHTVVAVRDQRKRLRAEADMRRMADSDSLTGLANRTRFNEMLERLLSSRRTEQRSFALLSLDLDRFKQVNDAHGHGAGDALLVRVAGRLAAVVREGHLVARIGGDEFSIIAPQVDGPDGARALADRVVEVLSRPYLFDGRIHDVSASVGVALAPSDGDTAIALVRNADLALYRAKHEGGNAYRMFEPGMDARVQARRRLELSLRRAAAREEFEVYYQPQVDARTGLYTGAEALIRWNDPERGIVPPAEFIAIAEETNLIAGIGEWVLRTACAQAMQWPAHYNVAVNLSPVQFRDRRLLSIVASALDDSGLPGHRLELEITENVLIEDEVAVLAMLEHFRVLGVRISLDDFGTGYSSLGHLRRFPFDKIKIDRSFVSRTPDDRDSAVIVRAIVSLGANLGMTTTAEGVETVAQQRFVVDAGCDQLQGYLYSRPVPPKELPTAFQPSPPQESPWASSASSIAATAS